MTLRETGELVYRTILILAIAALIIALTSCTPAPGTRRGTVSRIDMSPQYPRCTTWVGELLLDDVNGDYAQDAEANRWVFSVTSLRIAIDLQKHYGQRVTVRYHVGSSPCQGASGFMVDQVIE